MTAVHSCTSLESLELGVKANRLLATLGCTTPADLPKVDLPAVFKMPGVGMKTVRLIHRAAVQLGLTFGDPALYVKGGQGVKAALRHLGIEMGSKGWRDKTAALLKSGKLGFSVRRYSRVGDRWLRQQLGLPALPSKSGNRVETRALAALRQAGVKLDGSLRSRRAATELLRRAGIDALEWPGVGPKVFGWLRREFRLPAVDLRKSWRCPCCGFAADKNRFYGRMYSSAWARRSNGESDR